MLAIPFLIVAIALAAFLGPSLINAMIAIGIAALPTFLRLARGTALGDHDRGVRRVRAGAGLLAARVALRHVLPNMLPPLLIQVEPHGGRGHHRGGQPVVPGARPAARN